MSFFLFAPKKDHSKFPVAHPVKHRGDICTVELETAPNEYLPSTHDLSDFSVRSANPASVSVFLELLALDEIGEALFRVAHLSPRSPRTEHQSGSAKQDPDEAHVTVLPPRLSLKQLQCEPPS